MRKGMVITVGVGEGVENAIAKSIMSENPERVVFICTDSSKDKVAHIIDICKDRFESSIEIIDEEDFDSCYRKASEIVSVLVREYGAKGVTADITSGTKPMSSGLAFACVAFECERLVYVSGRREKGRVITGTEKVISVTPMSAIAELKLRLCIELFNRFQYDSCLNIIEDLERKIKDDEILSRFRRVERLAKACSAWDRFQHDDAFKVLREFKGEFEESKRHLYLIVSDKDDKAMIADLLQNAERRISEGKYDDAVARVYRCIEKVAQVRLKELGVDASDVELEKVPEHLREKYLNRKRLSLKCCYDLLKDLGDDVGRRFSENEELRKLLHARNYSILAHGDVPVERETALRMIAIAREFSRVVAGNIDEYEKRARFPRIEAYET